MTLSPGTRLGPYEIAARIGVGGMGEVYRATDTSLKRPVAIKALPATVAGDPERLARFQREAEVLAALNHPNIAAIHGIERSDGRTALVMELVDGPTLADRIAQGPIPLDEAIPIATQITEALEAAHELGIIHRDLKPANIKVRPDGTVKVLDFGLAKALDPAATAGAALTAMPTITTPAMTQAGAILGTAAYMSPEQARGKAVDKRTDIWAFGCVLFEMLTGRRAFEGDGVAEVIGAVIHKPVEWSLLPATTPATVRAALERCIEKDPKQRVRDIADVRLMLRGAFGAPLVQGDTRRGRATWWRLPATALVALAVGAGGAWVARAPAAPEMVSFAVDAPNAGDPAAFALSPDGRHLVFLQDDNGVPKLWLRSLDATAPRVIPGTDRASSPFWSPDSRRIAYFTPQGLEQVDLSGGMPSVITKVRTGITAGGAWNEQGVILFANAGVAEARGIFQVPASGGEPQRVTTPAPGDIFHAWPEFLPDGRHFLYVKGHGVQVGNLMWRDLDTIEEKVVRPLASKAWYSQTGHLVFRNDGPVVAQRFDASAGTVSGDVIQVAGNTWSLGTVRSALTLSSVGVLAHRAADRPGTASQLSWVDRQGKVLRAVAPPADLANASLENIALDRAGDRVAGNNGGPARDIWTLDLARGTKSRLTFDRANDSSPVFSPDGRTVVFYSARNPEGIYRKATNGAGGEELVAAGAQGPRDWSADGRFVSFDKAGDLWILPLDGDRTPFPFLATPALETGGYFSPDGRWLAYRSDETGREEVFVQSFPAKDSRFQISTTGGSEPRWRQDGRELFYLDAGGQLMSVPVESAPEPRFGVPSPVFQTRIFSLPLTDLRRYGVSADGQRFLMNVVSGASPPITVIMNWQRALEGR